MALVFPVDRICVAAVRRWLKCPALIGQLEALPSRASRVDKSQQSKSNGSKRPWCNVILIIMAHSGKAQPACLPATSHRASSSWSSWSSGRPAPWLDEAGTDALAHDPHTGIRTIKCHENDTDKLGQDCSHRGVIVWSRLVPCWCPVVPSKDLDPPYPPSQPIPLGGGNETGCARVLLHFYWPVLAAMHEQDFFHLHIGRNLLRLLP